MNNFHTSDASVQRCSEKYAESILNKNSEEQQQTETFDSCFDGRLMTQTSNADSSLA